MHITLDNNMCRVFELPETYPSGFCHGGGHTIRMQMVDWFQPIPPTEITSNDTGLWETWAPRLIEFLLAKRYIKPGRQYLVITDFGESLVFKGV